jgi:hypothetical protein
MKPKPVGAAVLLSVFGLGCRFLRSRGIFIKDGFGLPRHQRRMAFSCIAEERREANRGFLPEGSDADS